jgi:hypothetical protein
VTVRQFVDSQGRAWRVWQVTPLLVRPQTRVEDYLAACYRDGWIVFETTDGVEKRRLCPPPYEWEGRDDRDLDALRQRAEIVRPGGLVREGPRPVPADLPPTVPSHLAEEVPRDAAGEIDMRYLGVLRSFQYPGGRAWGLGLFRSAKGREGHVLRFVSGRHAIALADWPKDWIDLSDAGLVELLRQASPRAATWSEGMPRRRYDDPRAEEMTSDTVREPGM